MKSNRKVVHLFTKEEWDMKVEECNGICPRCGKSFESMGGVTLDHIIPINAVPDGTIYTIDDVQPLCRSCNSSKSDKLEVDFDIIEIDTLEEIDDLQLKHTERRLNRYGRGLERFWNPDIEPEYSKVYFDIMWNKKIKRKNRKVKPPKSI